LTYGKKKRTYCPDEQRETLKSLLNKGRHSARKLKRARILLMSDQQKKGKEVSETVGVSLQTVYNVCKRFAREGLETALNEKPRPGATPKLDARGEGCAMALACSEAPEGRAHWTMQMIADKLVELEYVDSISDETVRLHLKKKR